MMRPTARGLLVAGVVLLILAVLAGGGSLHVSRVTQASGTVTGSVFQDFNADSEFDAAPQPLGSARDTHVAGITVTAYDDAGVVRGSTVSVICTGAGTAVNAAGTSVAAPFCTGAGVGPNYSMNVTGTGPYRVEFGTLPSGLQPGSVAGATGPLVQFVPDGNSTVNVGVNRGRDYCQNNPPVVTPCFVSGDPLAAGTNLNIEATIVEFPYTRTGRASDPGNAPTYVALAPLTGSVWGSAYQRESQLLFTGAILKRHTGLGPLGIGGVYRTDFSSGSPVTTPYVDLRTLGLQVDDPNPASPLNVQSNSARGLPADKTNNSQDERAFAQVGRVGLGDMDISEDGTTVWLVNLYDRTVYALATGNPAVLGTALTPASLSAIPNQPWLVSSPCTNGVARPFGTKFRDNRVYVGVVCTGENGGTRADLTAHVYAYDVTTSSWVNGTGPIFSMSLNYQRGLTASFNGSLNNRFWNPWTDVYSDAAWGYVASPLQDTVLYPQPILSDIDFDDDGSMILAFMDRAGHQVGHRQLRPDGTGDARGITGISAGDLVRVCNVNGSFVLESNASCGTTSTAGAGNGQGPGGGEYYFDDRFDPFHQETGYGGIGIVPGTGELTAGVMDPIRVDSGGLRWFSKTTGDALRNYELYFDSGTEAFTFGKANGIGDIEVRCNAAPIEIGDRIWFDTDRDGVQDPGERPIAGVTVNLYDNAGNLIATAVTDANGTYRFSNAPGTNSTSFKYGLTALRPNGDYTLRLNNPADYTNPAILGGLTPTLPDNDPTSGGNLRDSEGRPVTPTDIRATVRTGRSGDNDHNFDFGFYVAPTKVILTSFTATWEGGSVVVRWETAAEGDTWGYRLLRSSTGRREDAVMITPRLIPAKGTTPASYSLRDATIQPGQRYAYWLVEVETNSATNEYGPALTTRLSGPIQQFYLPQVQR